MTKELEEIEVKDVGYVSADTITWDFDDPEVEEDLTVDPDKEDVPGEKG